MTEKSFFWGGSTVGDHGPYSDDQFSDLLRELFQDVLSLEGVLPGKLGELLVTAPSDTTVRISSGSAIVDGKIYVNSESVNLSVDLPASGFNYYTVVLDKDFTSQTVRLAILGPNTSTYPEVTQVLGVTWEIALARVKVPSTGGTTVTDVRNFCHFSSKISSEMLDTGAVTAEKLGVGAISGANIGSGEITGDKIASSTIPYSCMDEMIIPSTDMTVTGLRVTLIAAIDMNFGDVGFLNAAGKVDLGNANSIATSSCAFMATQTILANNPGTFLLQGIARNDAWNFSIPGLIFLSTSGVSGSTLSQSGPTGVDDVIQVLGFALSADAMFFNPQLVQIEHA